ncbi:MAG: ABC-F family ATP-binding cassette domain-containing protein [Pirellulaceae bacterium]
MILLTANSITKHYGPEPVLSGVSFEMRSGERISLVGPNGAGKTTLLNILTGVQQADGGTVELRSGARLGYLEQQAVFDGQRTVWDEAKTALSHLIGLQHESEALAEQIAAAGDDAERKRLGRRFDQLQNELQRHDAYHLDHKIERVLSGLGFDRETYRQPVGQLSGGQQNRLLLAKLLLAEPDVMLLDEPSNHLDIDATRWLEDFLVASPAAMLLVSHDRYLLDKVSLRTLELFRGTVDSYAGNYTAYRRQKAERLEVQRRTYEKQQDEIAKMEDFVRRNSAGLKHAQAEDRRKKLERIERVELPREIAAPPMGFPAAARTGDVVLRVEHLSKAFDRPLFTDLTFDILRGEKWGVLGPNGTGKTTLLRCILNQVAADEGRVIHGTGVKVGYFDQLLRCLDSEMEVVDAIRPSHKEFHQGQRRDMLARFGITGDTVFQKVGSLSGGERNRAALALLAASDANVLLLDEPTNHLDLWARASLEQAIRKFEGTVLFVSHDRYFINEVADKLLVVEPGRFRVIEGAYDTYLHLIERGLAAGQEARKTAAAGNNESNNRSATGGSTKDNRKQRDEPRRKRKFPYRKVPDIELEIAEREARIEQLTADLGDQQVLRDGERVKQASAELEQQHKKIAELYEHWEEATELN